MHFTLGLKSSSKNHSIETNIKCALGKLGIGFYAFLRKYSYGCRDPPSMKFSKEILLTEVLL